MNLGVPPAGCGNPGELGTRLHLGFLTCLMRESYSLNMRGHLKNKPDPVVHTFAEAEHTVTRTHTHSLTSHDVALLLTLRENWIQPNEQGKGVGKR